MTRARLVPAALVLLAALSALAASRDVDTRRFPRLVRVFLLPDEAALLKELKDDKDRVAFQRIFWARRDPTPGTPANEFEDNVRAAWARSDDLFSYPGQKGSETGCGQVLALLGRPEEAVGRGDAVRRPSVSVTGRASAEAGPSPTAAPAPGPGRQFDSTAYLRDGSTREPETWVYRDRPGLPYRFTSAELRVDFDAECRYAEDAGILGQDLRRAAEAFLTRPDIGYAKGADGHLLPAAAAASTGASGARALLASPRNDFPLAAEPKLVMRAPKGEVYVAGLVAAQAAAGGGPARLSLAAEAKDASGKPVASAARETTASAGDDGSLVASWGLALKPGKYRVTVAAETPDAKGAVSSVEVEVPDFAAPALASSPLVLFPDEPAAGKPDARDPFAAFQMGGQMLHPRFGNAFTPKDALLVVATVYGGRADPASGQAALRTRFSILKDGRVVARGAEDAYNTPDAVASVGPIPLAGYAPGAYVVRLDVTDAVSKETLRREAPLEIKP